MKVLNFLFIYLFNDDGILRKCDEGTGISELRILELFMRIESNAANKTLLSQFISMKKTVHLTDDEINR